MSEQINTLPDGHTRTARGGWAYYTKAGHPAIVLDTHMQYLRLALERRDDGTIHWRTGHVNEWGYTLRPIPDSQFPDGGMTQRHTVFDETTQKWTLPSIEDEIHAHHERSHDGDVAAAVAAICGVEIDIMHRKAVLANLNPDQKAVAESQYADFEDCIDEIIDANAEPALERAWNKSVSHITYPATEEGQVQKAHDFASAYLAHLNSRTQTQLGSARRYEYTLCLYRSLLSDRDKTSNRFLPKGVTIVTRKSTPAKAEERTAAQVLTALRNLISPAEGQPKNG